MKAVAVFPQRKEIGLVEVEEPALADAKSVKLRLLEVGICGTDREIASFQYGTPPAGSDRLVIGHESLGEVVEVGAEVTHVKPGDLAVVMVRRPCTVPSCLACRAGRQDFCFTGEFTERGIKQRDGFMTESVVDDGVYMIQVPASLREVAVLTEPLTIAEKALAQVWDIQRRLPWGGRRGGHRHRAVVLGAGPVGLLGAMALAAAGFHVHVYSREPSDSAKARLVQGIGATYLSAQDVAIPDLPRSVGSIDLVYEASGASRAAFELMEVLGTNGVFVFTGVPGRKAPIEVDTDLIMRNLVLQNQVVFGTVNAGRDSFEAAVRDLAVFEAKWPQALRSLITGRYPIESYRDLLTGERQGGIKEVIAMRGGAADPADPADPIGAGAGKARPAAQGGA
jgi:threonine dehydrogenase-like Zn-dependent dehydrogenase